MERGRAQNPRFTTKNAQKAAWSEVFNGLSLKCLAVGTELLSTSD